MNLLAHAVLADRSPAFLFGNVVADFVRPMDVERLPADVQAGIRLHRQVDAFTDCHPVVQRSIGRISGRWGWFSGILIDVYYDHILATEWDRHAPGPLRAFVEEVHVAVRSHVDLVPVPARKWMIRFIESDRFMSYAVADGSGVASALEGLSVRIAERMPRRAMRLQDALADLRSAHEGLRCDFREFFPLVQAFARDRWPRENAPSPRGQPTGRDTAPMSSLT